MTKVIRRMGEHALQGVRVVEIADETAEYVGLVLAGLGADIVKVEPPGGTATRSIGPFYKDTEGKRHSIYFWHYNRGKRSVCLDLDSEIDRQYFSALLGSADVLVDSTAAGYLTDRGFTPDRIAAEFPSLISVRVSPFGDEGPWARFRGSDLVHLALGGQTMNCGYDPTPDGAYDLPPIAPQMWHSYHVAGENVVMSVLAALYYHNMSGGQGQQLSCAIHEAVSKNTELDLMSWVMRRAPLYRQTCRHAAERVTSAPTICQTKDGRWFAFMGLNDTSTRNRLIEYLHENGMADGLSFSRDESVQTSRAIPGSTAESGDVIQLMDVLQRAVRKYTFDDFPWTEVQARGVMCAPLRRPEENLADEHWQVRGTYAEIEHPELERSFTYVTSKWLSDQTEWAPGRRAPLVDEDGDVIRRELGTPRARPSGIVAAERPKKPAFSVHGKPLMFSDVRVLDFTWFLASAGGTRFLSAMGAECIKVEWAAHPDTRTGAMAPVGGRAARERATGPLPGVTDSDMGGQFNNKNAGKRGISLNVRHPEGLEIAKRLVTMSDIVAEGFSPGVLEKWGLGYATLQSLKPDIIYAQQSGMGSKGTYGRFRAVGPIAAALSGASEMSGLADPALPAGWGYSYLDWIGAYSFTSAMLSALIYRQRTGKGQWIDASQTEAGIFIGGTALLNWSANGVRSARYGNRSPAKLGAPHGIYRCDGEDRWIAISCFTEDDWSSLCKVAERFGDDPRFSSLEQRIVHQDALDSEVSEWTAGYEPYALMHLLQDNGVIAGVCQTAEDRVDRDPQLASLDWLTEVTGTKIGRWPIAEASVRHSVTPIHIGGRINRGAPIYGEDNEFVYGELLGLTTAEIGRLAESGVI
jgi:crotonobetainyl-CoA:carnitine CoA-transferase CaiB-like acyl-CoA transferase